VPSSTSVQREIQTELSPGALCAALRSEQQASAWLDGASGSGEGWSLGPLVAIAPRSCFSGRGPRAARALAGLARRWRERRGCGGSGETGLLAVLGYDLLQAGQDVRPDDDGLPDLVVLSVERSVRFLTAGRALVSDRSRSDATRRLEDRVRRIERQPASRPPAAARGLGRPMTSLPRPRYLASVAAVRRHIERGDVYQANLCQRFSIACRGDALELYRQLAQDVPAPHSAFVETPEFSLASASPETFLRQRADGRIETRPIKGTRPRGATAEADRAAARALCESAKDRAELLMIVDLERNDLGRVCRTGSVRVTELAALRSYATVHHLVARVEGRLRESIDVDELLQATFPGGSISGAPKVRALQILRQLEPARRNLFTGALLWLGDDGTLDSSLLIRTVVLARGRAWIGAGGGVVADSDPEQEWLESNHKARALTRALGFEPEEAE
jgi:para-aminobenzoate synthetase component 1